MKIYDYEEIKSVPEEWISVAEALPPIGIEVIVYCPGEIERGRNPVTALCRYIRHEGAIDYYWDNNYPGNENCHLAKSVTMWRPMPPTPQEA